MERRVGGSGHDDGKIDLPLKDERPAASARRPRGPLSRLLEGAKRCSASQSPRQPGTARRGLAGASYGAGRRDRPARRQLITRQECPPGGSALPVGGGG